MTVQKTCKKHGPLSEEQIYVYKDGYTRCKLCDKINSRNRLSKLSDEQKKKMRQSRQKHYLQNREKLKARCHVYWVKNKEKITAQRKKQREERKALRRKNEDYTSKK